MFPPWIYASSASRCSHYAWVYTLQTSMQLCTYVRCACEQCHQLLWGEAPLVVCQHAGRDWPRYNGGCELTKAGGEGSTGGGGGREGGGGEAKGVVSRDKPRQMGQTMRHRHPPCMSTTPLGLLQTCYSFISPHVPKFLNILAFVCFSPFPSLSLIEIASYFAISSTFLPRGLFCSHANKSNFLPLSVWSLTLLPFLSSSLLFPDLIRRNLHTAARGGVGEESTRVIIDSTARHSCHQLCWNPLVWKADPISRFSGFHKQPQLSESREALCLLPSVSHPSLTALDHKERSAFISLFSVKASVAFEHLFGECFSSDIWTNMDRICQQTNVTPLSY